MGLKVAFVVTRFGEEINGGAEFHCRQVVERLKDSWEIEVLTTCALDYFLWENHFTPGRSIQAGYSVNRFPVDFTRPVNTFNSLYNLLINFHLLKYQNLDQNLGTPEHVRAMFRLGKSEPVSHPSLTGDGGVDAELMDTLEQKWMRFQGPFSSQLQNYIRTHAHSFDLFVFFSYNYATTYYSLPEVAKKSVLVPTAHAEACLKFPLFLPLLRKASYFLFNTEAEKKLLLDVDPVLKEKPGEVCGAGVDLRDPPADSSAILARFGLKDQQYLFYMGRIEESKGLLPLFHYFIRFRHSYQGSLKLVLIGKCYMDLPDHPDIHSLGFVTQEEKSALLQQAQIFVMPSVYESLSLALLEAWTFAKPAIVNGDCQVLRDHCRLSNGGFYYNDEASFVRLLEQLLGSENLRNGLGLQGKKYVRKHYVWSEIIDKYEEAAGAVLRSNLNPVLERARLSQAPFFVER